MKASHRRLIKELTAGMWLAKRPPGQKRYKLHKTWHDAKSGHRFVRYVSEKVVDEMRKDGRHVDVYIV